MNYTRPDKLEDALSLLADDAWNILSGGTDFYPALGDCVASGSVLDVSALPNLRDIADEGHAWRIGAPHRAPRFHHVCAARRR